MATPAALTIHAPASPVAGGRWVGGMSQQVLRTDAASAGSLTASFYSQQFRSVYFSSSNLDGTTKISRVSAADSEHVTLKNWGAVDIHNNAALLPLADGRMLAVYCNHQSSAMYSKVTATPCALDFGAETEIFWTGSGVSYPSLYRGESGRIWLFYCVNADGRDIYYRTSDNVGASWSAPTLLWDAVSNHRPYWGVGVAGDDILIAIAADNAYDQTAGAISGHYARFDAATSQWRNAAGVAYTLPLTEAGTEVYFNAAVHSRNAGFNPTPVVTVSGRPVIYIEGTNPNSAYYRCEWTGAAWSVAPLPEETAGTYNPSSPVPSRADPRVCYLIRPVSGRGQVWRYRTEDGGVTWVGEQLTSFASGNPTQQIMRISGVGPRWLVHQLSRSSNSAWNSIMHLGIN